MIGEYSLLPIRLGLMFRDIYRLLVGGGSGRYFPVQLVFATRGTNYYTLLLSRILILLYDIFCTQYAV